MWFLISMVLYFQPPQIFSTTGTYAAETQTPAVADAVVEHVEVAAPRTRKRYLAMFTASYCGPCQTWKLQQKPRVVAAGYTVVEYEMTSAYNKQKYGSRISSYPTFVVIDWDTGEWLSGQAVGGITAEAAISMLANAARVDAPPVILQQPLPVVLDMPILSPPVRWIKWPGYSELIDLETYKRNCDCPMCIDIRARQQAYWRDLKVYQAVMTTSAVPLPAEQQGCPPATVEAMLDAMKLTPDDRLADWGCGDGRILIAAAKRGVPGIGIEIDPARAAVAVQAVKAAGVSDLVTIETGDALDFDTTRVTAVTAYLYPPLLAKLAPKMMQVRVAASPYHQVPGLDMTQVGDVWIYTRPAAD